MHACVESSGNAGPLLATEDPAGNRQQAACIKNRTRPHEPHENFLIPYFRKSIETYLVVLNL